MSGKLFWLTQQKKKTNHILHLLLTLVTGGLWIIVWIICGISNSSHNAGIDEKIVKEMSKDSNFELSAKGEPPYKWMSNA